MRLFVCLVGWTGWLVGWLVVVGGVGGSGMHELRGEAYIVSLDKDAKYVCF